MTREELLARWRLEERTPVSGWDWSALADRIHDPALPWDFEQLCADAVVGATDVLDVGTGGGERLIALAGRLSTGWPAGTVATEGWAPNVAPARTALQPYGVPVVEHAPPDPLPFAADSFDLVLSRHTGFDPAEVARVLRPGGTLLTQQVGVDDLPELAALFGWESPASGLSASVAGLEAVGLEVARLAAVGLQVQRSQDFHATMTVDDVGALVRYLIMVPWYAPPDFGVDAYADLLLDLHEHRRRGAGDRTGDHGPGRGVPFAFTQSRQLLRAVLPA